MDGSYQDFQTCIDGHESLSATRNCSCPTASLKSMRDNHLHRKSAGVSASTLLSCPRAVALQEKYDYYEAVESGWHKFRGTLIHYLMEEDSDQREGIIKERRVKRYVDFEGTPFRVSGQMDHVDVTNKFLLDYKSKYRIPTKTDPRHEAQLNVYIWLLEDGVFVDDKTDCKIEIERAGIHYVTFNTKKGEIWKKMGYPVWDRERRQAFVEERAFPLYQWQKHGVFPECSPFAGSPYWKCDCVKVLEQLNELGVDVEELESISS